MWYYKIHRMRTHPISSLLVSLAIIVMFLFAPLFVRTAFAEGDFGMGADLVCKGCQNTDASKPNYCKYRVCKDPTKPVSGLCFSPGVCKAISYTGLDGKSSGVDTGLGLLSKVLGDLFGKLMQQKPPSSSTPPPYPTTPTDSTGCTGTRFPTHDINLISNPCADYTPEPINIDTNLNTDTCSTLNQALGLCTNNPNNCPNVLPVECSVGTHPVSGGQDDNGCVRPDTCVPDTAAATSSKGSTTIPPTRIIVAPTSDGFIMLPGGIRGDINVLVNGGTIVGGSRDVQGNVEVAGFYGSETFGGQGSQGLLSTWCRNRPWATNFLGKIVPPSFFDNLCKSRGYQVGIPPAAPAVILQQVKKPNPTTVATTTVTTPTIPPKVDIWAVPTSVPLGGRTSIFWNTQGVTSCTETSPNGGFNQNSLSGGAATQPITAPTTFSISCLAPDGTPVTGSVTVGLKI